MLQMNLPCMITHVSEKPAIYLSTSRLSVYVGDISGTKKDLETSDVVFVYRPDGGKGIRTRSFFSLISKNAATPTISNSMT